MKELAWQPSPTQDDQSSRLHLGRSGTRPYDERSRLCLPLWGRGTTKWWMRCKQANLSKANILPGFLLIFGCEVHCGRVWDPPVRWHNQF